MIGSSERNGTSRGMRPWLACAAVVLGAGTALACGDSDDKTSESAAKAPSTQQAAQQQPAATQAAPTTTQAAPAADPNTVDLRNGPTSEAEFKKLRAEGTVRLAAMRIGTPGKLTISPKGLTRSYEHWYKQGTVVTLKAKDTRTANFAAWSGACEGKGRTCKLKMTTLLRAVVGFKLDKAGAKGLSPEDKRLKLVSGP
jgi:pyruvate/2-oxoglutarate dehydrogenase complex dihydrolipoamide acyltransferase (E2) component